MRRHGQLSDVIYNPQLIPLAPFPFKPIYTGVYVRAFARTLSHVRIGKR